MTLPNNDPSGDITEDTNPMHTGPAPAGNTQSMQVVTPAKKIRKRFVVLLGIAIILILGGIGSWFGYQSGINSRMQNEIGQNALDAATQFQMGLDDQAAGRLDIAQQRFEYVIGRDQNFPGAQQKLAEVLMAIQISRIPTEVPTPTLTPTVDMRGEQDLFAQIQQHIKDSKWTDAISTIDVLRAKNLSYRAVDVDGLYYLALRGRGVSKITNGDLEGGIYDMTIAERFGPLDTFAAGLRSWARLYLNGASFWEVDWEKVINYFADIYTAVPNLRDGSGMTATERYRIALYKYGDMIAATGDYCKASQYYEKSLAIGRSATVEPKATEAVHNCHPDTATPEPQKPTDTLSPTVAATLLPLTPTVPGATPTVPTIAPTAAPTTEATPTTADTTPVPSATPIQLSAIPSATKAP
jgi:tetratricopeptide (TPR) repeat protein